ncbi:hypothetical protein [Dysgonomonas sp. BGC7]|uniref:hypothetical protein n=1 Tax=Dysgonomonas sp. BGC7 TaxID=1658008 RepID=UPI000AD863F4|nr:hypothetical protein [Dysgonomonas sp. BGC7]MBD8389934.1 hypothetical protein [Dysgonomonas sp. BGC7]
MKTLKYLLMSLVIMTGLMGFSSCGDDITRVTEEYYTGAEATNYNFVVGNSQNKWVWNAVDGRYECFFELNELSSDIYNYGSMVGGVFVNPGLDNEWLEMLPYNIIFPQNGTDPSYSVRISCAFTPGEVAFFFQPSDMKRNDNILAEYEFRITLMLDQFNVPK